MRIIVHRGTRQIGGSCIEISAEGSRIVLDAGLPLDAPANDDVIPAVSGLFVNDGPSVDGLFVSHSHVDHTGLVSACRSDVPVWLSAGTGKMMMAGGIFARQPAVPRGRCRTLVPGVPVKVGVFRVTAYPVDHSVFDAMAFLVEAGGRRLLYTSDLRFHGRKPGMTRRLVEIVRAAPLDALIIEGTRLGSRAGEENFSEMELEARLVENLKNAPGMALAMYSPLNVDRFVSFFRATRKAGRTLVVDPYQAFVLHLIRRQARVPVPGAESGLLVLMPPGFSKGAAGRRLSATRWAKSLSRAEISLKEIRANERGHVVLFRSSMRTWFGLPESAVFFFSYWPGYLRELRMRRFVDDVAAAGGRLLKRHASGHAHPQDLRSFVEEIRPRLLVPVHTTSPETWSDWCAATRLVRDGEPLDVF